MTPTAIDHVSHSTPSTSDRVAVQENSFVSVVDTVKAIAATILGGAVVSGVLYLGGASLVWSGLALGEYFNGVTIFEITSKILIKLGFVIIETATLLFAPIYYGCYAIPRWAIESISPQIYGQAEQPARIYCHTEATTGKAPKIYENTAAAISWFYREVIVVSVKVVDKFIEELIRNLLKGAIYVAQNTSEFIEEVCSLLGQSLSLVADKISTATQQTFNFIHSVASDAKDSAIQLKNRFCE